MHDQWQLQLAVPTCRHENHMLEPPGAKAVQELCSLIQLHCPWLVFLSEIVVL